MASGDLPIEAGRLELPRPTDVLGTEQMREAVHDERERILNLLHEQLAPSEMANIWAIITGADRPTHKPGDNHDYRLICNICHELGTIRVSIDPGKVSTPEAPGCIECGNDIMHAEGCSRG